MFEISTLPLWFPGTVLCRWRWCWSFSRIFQRTLWTLPCYFWPDATAKGKRFQSSWREGSQIEDETTRTRGCWKVWLPSVRSCMCSALDESNDSYCTYLSTEEFHLEHVQEFLRDLQVITIYLMLVQLGKKWKDWRRCLNKPMQTGWTMTIHESVPTC